MLQVNKIISSGGFRGFGRSEWVSLDLSEEFIKESSRFYGLVYPDKKRTKALYEEASIFGIEVHVDAKFNFHHLSRRFEYPWTVLNGNFLAEQRVLDAGSGDSLIKYRLTDLGCFVDVVDIDEEMRDKITTTELGNRFKDRVKWINANLENIPLDDCCYDRVLCLSVLEHCSDPLVILKELWRILKPGGRLLVSIDVAERVRWTHTINMGVASDILNFFGIPLPTQGKPTIFEFDEFEPQPGEPQKIKLAVLCFYVDKP